VRDDERFIIALAQLRRGPVAGEKTQGLIPWPFLFNGLTSG
jgi:hypothetical protein